MSVDLTMPEPDDDCPPQLNTKYVPSAEILLTGSLPSGHEPAKLFIEKSDKTKSRSKFFIKVLGFKWD